MRAIRTYDRARANGEFGRDARILAHARDPQISHVLPESDARVSADNCNLIDQGAFNMRARLNIGVIENHRLRVSPRPDQ